MFLVGLNLGECADVDAKADDNADADADADVDADSHGVAAANGTSKTRVKRCKGSFSSRRVCQLEM